MGGLAAATGPSLGAAVIQGFGWPWAVAFVAGRMLLNESRDESARQIPEFSGIFLPIAGMASLTYGIIHSEVTGWMDGQVIAAVSGGVLALTLFLRHSAKSTSAVLDLTLFRDRNFTFANAATLAFSIGFNAMYINNVLFLLRSGTILQS